jgi:NADH dehydrogenase [ubiquinone] 1 alpha subcomplex assembly factor 7
MKKFDNFNEFLIQDIKDNGPMAFGVFMAHALCHPKYGYYVTRDPFGVNGDFTTAPEISQMFGEMVGAWVVDIWIQMGQPKRLNLIECGAGRGTLMADILRVSTSVDGFLSAVQIKIIEASQTMRDIQAKALDGAPVEWVSGVEACTVDEPCVILGNEFLDALPVEQVRFMNGAWTQCYIDHDGDNFIQKWSDIQSNIETYLPKVKTHAAIYEIAPTRSEFIKECSHLIQRAGGSALFIDYGYAKSTHGDTVQAVKKHEYVPILDTPGDSDITAHVDFETLNSIAKENGMKTTELVTQGDFLRSLGIEHRANVLMNTILKHGGAVEMKLGAQNIQNDLNRLIDDNQMGQLFKVMCFYNGYPLNPAGF